MDGPLDDLAGRWQREGWVLVAGLVPPEEIDEALEDLWRLHPRPEEFHRGVQDSTRANFFAGADDRNLFASNIAAQGPAFRPERSAERWRANHWLIRKPVNGSRRSRVRMAFAPTRWRGGCACRKPR